MSEAMLAHVDIMLAHNTDDLLRMQDAAAHANVDLTAFPQHGPHAGVAFEMYEQRVGYGSREHAESTVLAGGFLVAVVAEYDVDGRLSQWEAFWDHLHKARAENHVPDVPNTSRDLYGVSREPVNLYNTTRR